MAKQTREPGSWGPLSLAVMQDARLTMADKAVYAACVVVAHGLAQCEVRHSTLSALASASKATVARSLPNLEAAGWLTIERAPGHPTVMTLHDADTPTAITVQTPPRPSAQSRHPLSTVRGGVGTLRAGALTAESDANPHRERDQENRDQVANAPSEDEDTILRELNEIKGMVRGNYVSPPSLSEVGVESYLFRDVLAGNAPDYVFRVPYIARQLDLFKGLTNPVRITEVLDLNIFYRDPSKPDGWGMKQTG